MMNDILLMKFEWYEKILIAFLICFGIFCNVVFWYNLVKW